MDAPLLRLPAMALRARALAVVSAALLGAPAFAQLEDPSPPPMVPVDEPAAAPAQPFEQLPPYQAGDPGLRYSNAPLDGSQAPAQPQPQPAPAPARARAPAPAAEGWMTSTRTKHVLGLLSGAVGLADNTAGAVANARLELDVARIHLLGSYTLFNATLPGLLSDVQVGQLNVMAGYAFVSSDPLTLRALGGVDVMTRGAQTAVGPILGASLRSMWGRIGVDGALLVTLFPYRQLEARAAFVVQWWGIFEAHLGWRVQVVDATASGTLATLFTSSPTVSGPVVAVGITF